MVIDFEYESCLISARKQYIYVERHRTWAITIQVPLDAFICWWRSSDSIVKGTKKLLYLTSSFASSTFKKYYYSMLLHPGKNYKRPEFDSYPVYWKMASMTVLIGTVSTCENLNILKFKLEKNYSNKDFKGIIWLSNLNKGWDRRMGQINSNRWSAIATD